jgi:hypothetical protein
MDGSAVLWIQRARRAVPLLRKLRRNWLSPLGENFKDAIGRENPGRPESLLGPALPPQVIAVA